MEFHEESLKGHSRAVWLSVGFLFASLVLLGSLFPFSTNVAQSKRPSSTTSSSIAQFYERVDTLERTRNSTKFYLVEAFLICSAGIVANLVLSMWRIKSSSRRVIMRHLDDFGSVFQEKILSLMDATERSIQGKASAVSQIQERIERITSELAYGDESAQKRGNEDPTRGGSHD